MTRKRAGKKKPASTRGMQRILYGVLLTEAHGNQRLAFDVFYFRREAVSHAAVMRMNKLYIGAKAVKLLAAIKGK